jgi:hypothetical protein
MKIRLEIPEEFTWLAELSPRARKRILFYALRKLTRDEIANLLSFPAPHSSSSMKNLDSSMKDFEDSCIELNDLKID